MKAYESPRVQQVFVSTQPFTEELIEGVLKGEVRVVDPYAPTELPDPIPYMMPPRIPMVDYPSGQENRRRRREMERKMKKHKRLF